MVHNVGLLELSIFNNKILRSFEDSHHYQLHYVDLDDCGLPSRTATHANEPSSSSFRGITDGMVGWCTLHGKKLSVLIDHVTPYDVFYPWAFL
jgi:hypothetical protein